MDRKSITSGAVVIFIGLLAIVQASDLNIGTPRRMGPGFFPIMLACLLIILGAGIAGSGLIQRERKDRAKGEGQRRSEQELDVSLRQATRPFLVILAAITTFALLIGRTGLIPAVMATVLVSTAASQSFSWKRTAILALCVPLGAYLIFHVGLGLSIPAFTWG